MKHIKLITLLFSGCSLGAFAPLLSCCNSTKTISFEQFFNEYSNKFDNVYSKIDKQKLLNSDYQISNTSFVMNAKKELVYYKDWTKIEFGYSAETQDDLFGMFAEDATGRILYAPLIFSKTTLSDWKEQHSPLTISVSSDEQFWNVTCQSDTVKLKIRKKDGIVIETVDGVMSQENKWVTQVRLIFNEFKIAE